MGAEMPAVVTGGAERGLSNSSAQGEPGHTPTQHLAWGIWGIPEGEGRFSHAGKEGVANCGAVWYDKNGNLKRATV